MGKPCARGHSGERYAADGQCVQCGHIRNAAYRAANRERERLRHAAHFAANREACHALSAAWKKANTERVRAKAAEWRKANAERAAAASAAWWASNAERGRAANAAWVKANPEANAASTARRNARKQQAPGRGVTAEQWQAVLSGSLGICAYCNERRPLTVDHIEPLSKGGAHDEDNIAAVCKACNSSKRVMPLVVWLARLAYRRAAAA